MEQLQMKIADLESKLADQQINTRVTSAAASSLRQENFELTASTQRAWSVVDDTKAKFEADTKKLTAKLKAVKKSKRELEAGKPLGHVFRIILAGSLGSTNVVSFQHTKPSARRLKL
jgi:hypothetical protein